MTDTKDRPTPAIGVEDDSLVATQIRERERALIDPSFRSDPERVAELLADEFMELSVSGRVYGKADLVKRLSRSTRENWQIEGFTVRMLGPGVALSSYRAVRLDPASGNRIASWRSSVWKMLEGRWQVVFHHGTAIG